MSLTIVGLGRNKDDISVGALEALRSADAVYLRTEKTVAASALAEQGICYTSFDDLYRSCRSFDSMRKKIVKAVKDTVRSGGNIVYAVDGAVSEDLAAADLIKTVKGVKIFEGVSRVSYAVAECGLSGKGYTAVSAYQRNLRKFSLPLVIFDLDSKFFASEWKLKLFSLVGEEMKVDLFSGGKRKRLPLYEIDTLDGYDYSTTLVIDELPLTQKERFTIEDLFEILYILRSENGCPWDKVQTKESIRENLVEEAYELVDAINKNDDDMMLEEIGDVLMQAAFHTVFAEERGVFTREDVVSALCEKLITRHTHVFGTEKAQGADSALEVWTKNKQKEKGFEGAYDYVSAVPSSFPAALRAEKTFKRAQSSNYQVTDYSIDNICTLANEIKKGEVGLAGEFLLACVSFAKSNGVSCEQALADETERFLKVMEKVESALVKEGRSIKTADKAEVEKLYNEIKKSSDRSIKD
ncbi:MAG: MazG family protein [Clostridia bacterium]|nr:MazG family protein [Clostridia bacterium]